MAEHKTKRANDKSSATYLQQLAERIRTARAQRGMTRKALAHDSGVSERFIAELEGGSGNPSLLVLRGLAEAVHLPLEALVREGPPRPVDYTLILQALDRLTSDEYLEIRKYLAGRFPRATGGHKAFIALIGLRGAGKTTLGTKLAEKLGVPFIELDREVERAYGAGIGAILELHGQSGYLRYERETLERLLDQHKGAVIAVGGGMPADPESLELLLDTTRTVWVRALPKEHMQRVIDQGDLRPMASSAQAMDDLRKILKAREPFYRQATIHLNTSGKTVNESVRELLLLLEK